MNPLFFPENEMGPIVHVFEEVVFRTGVSETDVWSNDTRFDMRMTCSS